MISESPNPKNPGRKTHLGLVTNYFASTFIENTARKVFTLVNQLINEIHVSKDLSHAWHFVTLFPTTAFPQDCEVSRAANT